MELKFENKQNLRVYEICKRIIDIIGAGLGLILLSPIIAIVACAVKFTSKGQIFFSQKRVGKNGELFEMYKFRSMVVNAEELKENLEDKNEMSGPMFKIKDDPRVTKVGKFIRKTSIDELSQLWNVLKGDMSLVGPRPLLVEYIPNYSKEQWRRHEVKPGITGWAQVNGFRGDTSIRSRIEHDLYYIENWSLGLDIKILFLTFFKGFVNKNAY